MSEKNTQVEKTVEEKKVEEETKTNIEVEGEVENEKFEEEDNGEEEISDTKQYKNFDDFGLNTNLLRGIYGYGFEIPSIIQKRGIPALTMSNGRDVIGQAQSGTGKTGTFVIGMLQNLDVTKDECQAIIMCHTRELAHQTHLVILALSEKMNVKSHCLIGGKSVENDKEILSKGVHVVVGTPGRMTQMLDMAYLNADNLKMLIIDEADEMLSKDFREAVYDIFSFLPESIQICLFSATMPTSVFEITEKFMRKPIKILVKKEQLTLQGIKQYYVNCSHDKYKFDVLCDLYKHIQITQCVIFCNSRKRVDELAQKLEDNDHTVSKIHGDIKFVEREDIMRKFRQSKTRVLIGTNLIARGIDAHHVSLVINFDMPKDREVYLHRIGRSGRYGRKGVSINFITFKDQYRQKEIETYYNTEIQELPANLKNLIT